jgi:endoglucanase
MKRRTFLLRLGSAAAAAALHPALSQAARQIIVPDANKLPRWRGFNMLAKFNPDRPKAFEEWKFEFMAEHGFDFARLPLSYHCWMKPDDWMSKPEPQIADKKQIKDIDKAIKYGKRYDVHVNINLHRIQGYCVNPPAEPLNVWKDEKALEAAAWQWAYFAQRYKGISNKHVSFDLINEPAHVEEADYVRVVNRLVEAIRSEDADRLIVADGLWYGTQPVFGLKDTNLGQSTRGYNPMQVSHHRASWVAGSTNVTMTPTWPMTIYGEVWDKERLRRDYIAPWKKLENEGVGIHVGEWGCYNYTPHDVALRWMEDNLSLWQEAGWGWSLWNLEGDFGVVNSERTDVNYEDWKGRKLDRAMLELLKKY